MTTVEPNTRYELTDGDEEMTIDVTGVKGETVYAFCVDTDCQVVLDNASELVADGRLRPVDREP